ncbi:MAG: D-2-hydroxyacid dehydrogenase [Acidobacteria bacterium]|nr:MAG: D-2-hydroxyacid dehydrogenase [Acidobacteriota bacterium]
MPRFPETPRKKLLIATHHRLDLWIAPEWFGEKLQKEFPQLEITRVTSYEGIERDLADAEILFSQSLWPEQFAAARKLRWIHSSAAAVHQFIFPELVKSDVILTNAREVHGPGVAEHVMALILAVAKRIPESVRFQQKRVWGQEILWNGGACPLDIAGATLGLVGFGSIGRSVARHAYAMGMRVVVVREHPEQNPPESVQQELPSSRLGDLLAQADYVVLSPPLTPATHGMIGREQLARMKSSAFLVNVGRGPLIDETALIEALRERKIAGAALDVFDKEPLPADSPLWDLENLLITPHTAGMDQRLWERHYSLFSENLRRYFKGEPLLGLVDKQQGY